FIILIIASTFSCEKDDPSDVVPNLTNDGNQEQIHYRDSILKVYNGISQENRILSIYTVLKDTMGNHFVTGNIREGYWVGAFDKKNNILSERYFIIPDSLDFNKEDSVILRLPIKS